MKKSMYLVPLAQEICLNQESFVCASANLGDIPISPASMEGFDMLGTDELGLGGLGSLGGINMFGF